MSLVIVDSNVFIYYLSKDKSKSRLLEKLLESFSWEIAINDVVVSEVALALLKLESKQKSYELKHKPKVVKSIDKAYIRDILSISKFLSISEETAFLSLELMDKYGLLPNDALILATCKTHNIKYLATFDEDFKEPAKKEGIRVVSNL